MTKREIARDAIAQSEHVYFTGVAYFDNFGEHCFVCAIGGLFLGLIKRIPSQTGIPSNELIQRLSIAFSEEELREIEVAYQCGSASDWKATDFESARQWHIVHEHMSDRERFIAICENIIHNDGFDPNIPQSKILEIKPEKTNDAAGIHREVGEDCQASANGCID